MAQKVSNYPKLTKPPILEALLDIRVNLAPGFDVNELEKIHELVKADFEEKNVQKQFETKFEIKEGENPIVDSKKDQIGFVFKAKNGEKLMQAQKDGYTYNKLKSYEGWDQFIAEAKKFWEIYKKHAKPVSVNRLALRYIDLVEIPQPVENFKDYFLTTPEIAPEIPQALSEFIMRLVIPDPITKNVAIITESIDKAKLNDKILPLIFDTDVFQLVELKADHDFWPIFESLKDYKNKIFFGTFTKKALELFK